MKGAFKVLKKGIMEFVVKAFGKDKCGAPLTYVICEISLGSFNKTCC